MFFGPYGGGWVYFINTYILNFDIINGLEDINIWRIMGCLGSVECRGVVYKYWNGYNGDYSQILYCVMWVRIVINGLIWLNNGICEYWWWYIDHWISSILYNVLGGVKGMEYDAVFCFWSEIFIFLSDYGKRLDRFGYFWFMGII